MKCSSVVLGSVVIMATAVLIASAMAADAPMEPKAGAAMPGMCPACTMTFGMQGEPPAQMKKMMEEAGISDEMRTQCRSMMMAPMYMDSPAVLVGMAVKLGLTDDQKNKLMEIEKGARKQALAVLNEQQVKQLGKISDTPMAAMDGMKQMHEKMKPVMEKMVKEGKQMPMSCPMMGGMMGQGSITK